MLQKLGLSNLSPCFYITLLSACGITAFLSFLGEVSGFGLFVAILGILYAFFAGEGRVVCFVFGIFYSIFYAFIAFDSKLYGDVMLNLFYLPINILGLYTWQKNSDSSKVIICSLEGVEILICMCAVGILGVIYGWVLQKMGGDLAYINAFSTILQIMAFFLQARRYVQSYLFVSVANVLSTMMWVILYHQDSKSLPQLLNSLVFLGIGLWYWRIWAMEVRK